MYVKWLGRLFLYNPFIAQKYLNPKYTSAEWTTGSVGVFNERAVNI